jgi:hypothetical protein
VARTDNHTLEYLKKFSDYNSDRDGRRSWQSLNLLLNTSQENPIQHEDAFSRLIAAVSGDPLNRKNIQRQQMKDSFSHKIRGNDCFEGQYYLDIEGLTYKRTGNFLEDQLIIPHSLNQTAS